MWGSKSSDNDVPDELDQGKILPEELFSTFQHEKDEECPAFRDNSKVIINEPSTTKNNKKNIPVTLVGVKRIVNLILALIGGLFIAQITILIILKC